MKTDLTFLKPLVAAVLQDDRREWSVQGFGFLRTYFGPAENPKRFRLNLWDSRFTVPNVSTIHTHPWDFTSIIVAGLFANQRYDVAPMYLDPSHTCATIKTGVGGGRQKSFSHEQNVLLTAKKPELYGPGDVYHQKADEIHETIFKDGTVTLNERVGDTEHATVFWPYNTEWVDAIPRVATKDEVIDASISSLRKWF